MSYDADDAARDSLYDELYTEISSELAREDIRDSLKTYYLNNANIARPAFLAYDEGRRLLRNKHYAAATIFFATYAELLFKSVLLKPIVCGLVKYDGLAEVISKNVLNGSSSFDRYSNLLRDMFLEILSVDIRSFRPIGSNATLIERCKSLQEVRNGIVHRGDGCTPDQAKEAWGVAEGVCNYIIVALFKVLKVGLTHDYRMCDLSTIDTRNVQDDAPGK